MGKHFQDIDIKLISTKNKDYWCYESKIIMWWNGKSIILSKSFDTFWFSWYLFAFFIVLIRQTLVLSRIFCIIMHDIVLQRPAEIIAEIRDIFIFFVKAWMVPQLTIIAVDTTISLRMHIQSSAVTTRSNIVRYCISNCRDWGRISIRW